MISHEIKNNRITITATLQLKNRDKDPDVKIDKRQIEQYIRENKIDVGKLLSDGGFAANSSSGHLTARWIYFIGPDLKKSLTSPRESATIKKQNSKKLSPRTRAKRIAEARKESTSNEDTKPKARRTRTRKKPTNPK